MRRDQHSTKLEWLDPENLAVAGRADAKDACESPFVGHNGLQLRANDGYSMVSYSPDGRLLARVRNCDSKEEPSGSEVSVIDTASGREVLSIRGHSPEDIVQGVAFSPQGSYLVICSRFRPAHAGAQSTPEWSVASHAAGPGPETPVATGLDDGANKNLAMWHVASGGLAGAWSTHQHWDPDRWPYVQWRSDETQAAWAVPGALVMLRAHAHPTTPCPTLHVAAHLPQPSREPCTFALAPSKPLPLGLPELRETPPPRVAVFIHQPSASRVDILELTTPPSGDTSSGDAGLRGDDAAGGQQGGAEEAAGAWKTVAAMPLEEGEDAALKWSLDASALLVLSTTHVDETNEHYYGTTSLRLIGRRSGKKKAADGAGGQWVT